MLTLIYQITSVLVCQINANCSQPLDAIAVMVLYGILMRCRAWWLPTMLSRADTVRSIYDFSAGSNDKKQSSISIVLQMSSQLAPQEGTTSVLTHLIPSIQPREDMLEGKFTKHRK